MGLKAKPIRNWNLIMDPKDIRMLKILEKAEDERLPSQRDLARELNVSLGLVNSFIKRLVKKGYFKITHIPKNRMRYMLTPKGAAEKTRLTYLYVQYSYQFYKNARQKLRNLFNGLESRGQQRIVFYGAGDLAEIAYISLQETSLELVAIIDDIKVDKKFIGYIIESPGKLNDQQFDKILITAVNSRELLIEKLIDFGIPLDKILVIQ
jgi:DNA-binding MarR family transcriptional regulator